MLKCTFRCHQFAVALARPPVPIPAGAQLETKSKKKCKYWLRKGLAAAAAAAEGLRRRLTNLQMLSNIFSPEKKRTYINFLNFLSHLSVCNKSFDQLFANFWFFC